ncbi:MAG: SCO family protein [Nitrospirota bacterium]
MNKLKYHLFLLLILISSPHAFASFEQSALTQANNAIGKKIGDYTLVDQDGKKFSIRELNGKPYVLSLIYTSCGHECPTIIMHLQDAFNKAGGDFGNKFNSLTIGFNPEKDTPEQLKRYGKSFTNDFRKWRFAAADKKTIEGLARDLGFYYNKVDEGFDHINMVTIVDKEGKIYKQIYGLDFKPVEILEPLSQSINMVKPVVSKPLSIIERIKLFCYKYDEATGKYKLDYGVLVTISIGAVLQILTMGWFIYLLWGKKRPKEV